MTQILSSANIKREILAGSDITGIRKRYQQEHTEAQEFLYLEMGEAFEQLTQQKGWMFLEAYMMKNITGGLLSDDISPYTKGFVNLMHYVDQVVKVKNEIQEKRANETR